MILLILLSIPNKTHYFGRFQNVFLRSNNTTSLREVFKVSQFCKDNLSLKKSNSLLCDKASEFILKASLGEKSWNYFKERHTPEDLSSRISSLGGIENVLGNNDIVGVLALSPELQINPQGSLLAKSSDHWDEQIVSKNLVYDKHLEEDLKVLEKMDGLRLCHHRPIIFIYVHNKSMNHFGFCFFCRQLRQQLAAIFGDSNPCHIFGI